MEKGKPAATAEIALALAKFHLEPPSRTIPPPCSSSSSTHSSVFPKNNPRRLVSICLGVLGQHFEDVVGHLPEISVILPTNIKMAIAAIARRRKLLDDDVLNALIDDAWDILDISGSDVTDLGLTRAAETCPSLRAVDIRRLTTVLKHLAFGGVPHFAWCFLWRL
ncbi:hypothetical protein Taro_000718, partial [Colocasia esculenta]|nr:hypothetical protein [Colocasia esculenta]